MPPTRPPPCVIVYQNRPLHPRTRLRLHAQRRRSNAPWLNVLVHIRRKIEATFTLPAGFSSLQVIPLLPPRKTNGPPVRLKHAADSHYTMPTRLAPALPPIPGRGERPAYPNPFLPRLRSVSITTSSSNGAHSADAVAVSRQREWRE
jgi:hypothetical protein